MDSKNHLEKNPIQKHEKTVKIKVKLPHVNKKSLPIKRIFVQTPYSHSTLKLERKNFTPPKPLAFSLHFLFRRDQNHYSNLTSKIMKMCEQILKKNIAGQVLTYNSKNFHWLNRKTRPGMDYEWIEKTILKKIRSKIRKKQKNVKMPHMNKKTTSEKWKFK